MFDICAVCILTLSSYIVALSLKWVKKRSEPYGFREHNVCSSTTPVFHFLTWKMFPSKRNRKNHFHSDTRSVILTPNVPFFPPPHQHIARPRTRPLSFPPLPLSVSFVICGSCVSLFYCFIWPLLCCGQQDNNSQSLLFTRAAVGCHILCPHLLVFLGVFSWWVAALGFFLSF